MFDLYPVEKKSIIEKKNLNENSLNQSLYSILHTLAIRTM